MLPQLTDLDLAATAVQTFLPAAQAWRPCRNLWQLACCLGRACSACTLRVLCVLVQSLQQMWGRAVSAVAGTLADSLPSFFHSIWKIH